MRLEKGNESSPPWREALYDHYKDTFAHIRDREKARDRQFLVIIALFAGLSIATNYTLVVSSALTGITVVGVRASLAGLPASAVLTALWAFTLALSLRYCSTCIAVERQYSYIHTVEEQLSKASGDRNLFGREGRAYNDAYPALSEWVWIVYVFIFPVAVVVAVTSLLYFEWTRTTASLGFKIADTCIGAFVAVTFALYRIIPLFNRAR